VLHEHTVNRLWHVTDALERLAEHLPLGEQQDAMWAITEALDLIADELVNEGMLARQYGEDAP